MVVVGVDKLELNVLENVLEDVLVDTVEVDFLDDVLLDEAVVVGVEPVDDVVEVLERALDVLKVVLLGTLWVSDVAEVILVGVETLKLDVPLVVTDVEEDVGVEEELELYKLEEENLDL